MPTPLTIKGSRVATSKRPSELQKGPSKQGYIDIVAAKTKATTVPYELPYSPTTPQSELFLSVVVVVGKRKKKRQSSGKLRVTRHFILDFRSS
jgi:hypothetical protein